MKIDEIPQNGPVILAITKGNQTAEICAEVDQIVNKGIILKPIEMDGKVLNLEGSEVLIQLLYEREGEKPIIWRNIAYRVFRYNNCPVIALFDKRDGAVHNRRTTFRLDMDVQGILNKSEKVIIHDISGTGISFYVSDGREKEIGSSIVISFNGDNKEIGVTGKILRKQVCEDGRVLYGCMINSSLTVDRFISEEQGRRARKSRR